MGDTPDREAELRGRIARLEAELARFQSETEAWRRLFARTTSVFATFTREMDELVQSFRSGKPPTMADEPDATATVERPDVIH